MRKTINIVLLTFIFLRKLYNTYKVKRLIMMNVIIRSMSRKATPADNACIECFHSFLKSETFYLNNERNSSNYIVKEIVEKYIKNYNKNRIQQKLGCLSPIEYRKQAA